MAFLSTRKRVKIVWFWSWFHFLLIVLNRRVLWRRRNCQIRKSAGSLAKKWLRSTRWTCPSAKNPLGCGTRWAVGWTTLEWFCRRLKYCPVKRRLQLLAFCDWCPIWTAKASGCEPISRSSGRLWSSATTTCRKATSSSARTPHPQRKSWSSLTLNIVHTITGTF